MDILSRLLEIKVYMYYNTQRRDVFLICPLFDDIWYTIIKKIWYNMFGEGWTYRLEKKHTINTRVGHCS
jgi:hypothetical protein